MSHKKNPPASPTEVSKRSLANLNRSLPEGIRRGKDGRLMPRDRTKVLTDEITDDYSAMEHVFFGRPIRTRQQYAFKKLHDADPAKFWDRMQRLKSPGTETPDETELEADLGTDRVMELLANEWKEVEKMMRHKPAIDK